jgi:hypothetical protein
MRFGQGQVIGILGLGAILALSPVCFGAPRKGHTVILGAAKKVPYSKSGDPAGAQDGEDSLRIRPLVVDAQVKEWTTGEAHDVTDRTFLIRRALRLNDVLPGEKPAPGLGASHWVWQRGPWLLVDRATGHASALKLPQYDPAVSRVSWFRDYGAYCGLTASGKSLYAVVAQLSAHKPAVSKKLAAYDRDGGQSAACPEPEWQREPLRVTFRPAGRDAATFDLAPGSAVLVEDSGDDETAGK